MQSPRTHEDRAVARHERDAEIARGGLPGEIEKANALLAKLDAPVTVAVDCRDDEPERLVVRQDHRVVASIDYTGRGLAGRRSVLQAPGAYLRHSATQEARAYNAVALALAKSRDPAATETDQADRAIARSVMAPLHRALSTARRHAVTTALKGARKASIKGREPAANFAGAALSLAKLTGDVAVLRSNQAVALVELLPIMIPEARHSAAVAALAEGTSIKKVLAAFHLPWAVRKLKAGIAGVLIATDPALIGQLCGAANDAGVIPEHTREQRYWLKLIVPLGRRWATEEALQGCLVWLARNARDDLRDRSVAGALVPHINPGTMADWLTDGGAFEEAWRPGLTLEEGWQRAQRWATRHPVRQAVRQPFPKPWLARGVIGDFEILPLTDAEQLAVQGQAQRNCVATYAGRVASGHCFIYSVRRGTDTVATLEVGCAVDTEGQPVPIVNALRGPCNAAPKPAVAEAVTQWLADSTFLPPPSTVAAASRFCGQPDFEANENVAA